MGKVKALLVDYAELKGVDLETVMGWGTSVEEMEAALADRAKTAVPTTFVAPTPWLTLSSYVDIALNAVAIEHYAIEVANGGLNVTWGNHLLQIHRLEARPEGGPTAVFRIKLTLAVTGSDSRPLAMDFKKEYTDVAVVCANLLSGLVIRQAIAQMEADWAQQDSADNAAAESAEQDLCERGEALAEQWAQLDYSELEAL